MKWKRECSGVEACRSQPMQRLVVRWLASSLSGVWVADQSIRPMPTERAPCGPQKTDSSMILLGNNSAPRRRRSTRKGGKESYEPSRGS